MIRAPKAGVIEKVLYEAGQAVKRHAQLVQFQEQGEEQKGEDGNEEGPEAEWEKKNSTAGGLVQGDFAGKTVFQELRVKDKFKFKIQ